MGPFKGPAEKSGSLLPLPYLPRGKAGAWKALSFEVCSSLLPLEALGIRSSCEGLCRTQHGPGQCRPMSHSPGVEPAASVVRADPLGRERYRTLRLPCSRTLGELPLQAVAPTASQLPPEFRRGQDGGFSTKDITTTGIPGRRSLVLWAGLRRCSYVFK